MNRESELRNESSELETSWLQRVLRSVQGVAWFELRRSFSPARLSLWFIVAFFPVCLIALVRTQAGNEAPDEGYIFLLFLLVVRVASVLGLLLWATPLISNEIEGRTWMYVTTRPYGSLGIVAGKYSVALLWSVTAGLISAGTAVIASGVEEMFRIWWVMSVLVVLGCVAYGALFTLIGALIQRRAMVIGIIYIVVVEGILSMVPATINRFTISYRLLGLLFQWTGLEQVGSEQYSVLYGDGGAAFHIAVIGILTVFFLVAASLRVRRGGYLTEPEG